MWAKIATIGSARNASVTIAVATNTQARSARFIAGDPRSVEHLPPPVRYFFLAGAGFTRGRKP